MGATGGAVTGFFSRALNLPVLCVAQYLVFCVVSFIFAVFLLVLVPNIACVSGLFIPDCLFGFLNVCCENVNG
jgi:uncharacterized protein YqhQ